MDEAFGLLVVCCCKKGDAKTLPSTSATAFGSSKIPFRANDIKVWDRKSPHDAALDAIAGKLFDVYRRMWIETGRVSAEKQQLCELIRLVSADQQQESGDDLTGVLRHGRRVMTVEEERVDGQRLPDTVDRRDLIEIVALVHDALKNNQYMRQESKVNARLKKGNSTAMPVAQELRHLRQQLALVTERLKVTEKEKRDLRDALQRSRPEPTKVDLIRAKLDKEIEKNVHLQSVVDDMYAAVDTSKNHNSRR